MLHNTWSWTVPNLIYYSRPVYMKTPTKYAIQHIKKAHDIMSITDYQTKNTHVSKCDRSTPVAGR